MESADLAAERCRSRPGDHATDVVRLSQVVVEVAVQVDQECARGHLPAVVSLRIRRVHRGRAERAHDSRDKLAHPLEAADDLGRIDVARAELQRTVPLAGDAAELTANVLAEAAFHVQGTAAA